jgi:hypothetical protein
VRTFVTPAKAVLTALAALMVGACSSSTEPVVPVDGFRSTFTVEPQTALLGQKILAVWMIENRGPDTVTRVYNLPGAQGFILMISSTQQDSIVEQIDSEAEVVLGDSLVLPPHSSMVLHSQYLAVASGSAKVSACLPPDSTQGTEWVCDSKTITVNTGPSAVVRHDRTHISW